MTAIVLHFLYLDWRCETKEGAVNECWLIHDHKNKYLNRSLVWWSCSINWIVNHQWLSNITSLSVQPRYGQQLIWLFFLIMKMFHKSELYKLRISLLNLIMGLLLGVGRMNGKRRKQGSLLSLEKPIFYIRSFPTLGIVANGDRHFCFSVFSCQALSC